MTKRVVIVGGGISGLAAVYRLKQIAPDFALTLIEAEDRLGGKIVTEKVDGFVIEGGPDTFLAVKPRGIGLCRELGLEEHLHGTNERTRRSFIMHKSELHEIPEGLTGLIPSRLAPILKSKLFSLRGKLRMGLDVFIPARRENGDETLAAFVKRRLGNEAYASLIGPLMSGIYAGDGEQLSLGATFPQLRQMELNHGSLIRGVLAARKNGAAQPKSAKIQSAFLAPRGGMGEIIAALERKLHDIDIRLGTRAQHINTHASAYTLTLEGGETLHADAIILAAPAFVSADLLSDLDPQLCRVLRDIRYVSTATVSVAYPRDAVPHTLNGYGYIIPRDEGRSILACTWTSSKLSQRAPEGFALFRAFIGRDGQESVLDRTDEGLIQLVRDELRSTLGITKAPILSRVFRWPQAMPQYTLGHLDRLAQIDQRLAAHHGLFVVGNAYRGVGIPDCIASGEQAAEKIMSQVQSQ